ncbi:MAG: response regulator [Rhodospirillaceae bacterium]
MKRPDWHPYIGRLTVVVCALLAGWGALVWVGGNRMAAGRIGALIESHGTVIGEQADAISYNLHHSVTFLRGVPIHLANEANVVDILRGQGPDPTPIPGGITARTAAFRAAPALMALSYQLKSISEQLGFGISWVIDAAGNAVASSNFDQPESFVGTNFSDRDYFKVTKNNRPGQQFAVGRKTGIPGIYFSTPVMDAGRFIGAAVIKVDIDRLAPLLGSADAFVTDEYGAVIMARRPALYLCALPENRLTELSPEARELRYRRRDLQPLSITPYASVPAEFNKYGLLRFEESPHPYLMTERAETEEGMTVHVMNQLVEIDEIERNIRLIKILVFLAGASLIIFTGGLIRYFRESAKHVQSLQENQVALEAEKKRAEAASEAKAQFLANMSHEIRTPMSGVLGLTYLMMGTELTPHQRDYLNKISMSAAALLDILNDILDLSKIDAGKLRIESVEFGIDAILDHICNVSASPAAEKNIELLFHINPSVPKILIGDPLRLRQVLLNLAGNAIKFTERGEVVLSVSVTAREDGRVTLTFSVSDTGIGITDEQQKSLFKDFSQVDESMARRFGGTGLGLSICKRLVEMMGGVITVKSQHNRGTTFAFTVPFGCGMEEEEDEFILPPQLRNLRALVVDDNPTACLIEAAILISWSMRVEIASSGGAAIKKIVKADADGRPFSLVIMDWQMPGIDGFQAAQAILDNNKLSRRPTMIMASAHSGDDLPSRARAAGISAVLNKPFAPSQLYDCVASLFGGGRKPSAPPQVNSARPSNATCQRLHGARILVVEDNAINRQIAVELLKRVGVVADVAENGRQGANIVLEGETKYDLILMDVQMPVMDGLAATELIRKQYVGPPLPIVAMTAHAMEHEKRRCLAAGMDDHIAKPLDTKAFYETLERWIVPHDHAPTKADATLLADETGTASVGDLDSLFEVSNPPGLPSLPKYLPPFDLVKALERVANDPELLKMLIIGFHDGFNGASREMRQLIDEHKLEEASILAHSIKGAAGSLDATSLYLATRDLEQALRPSSMNDLLSEFDTALADSLAAAATLKGGSAYAN